MVKPVGPPFESSGSVNGQVADSFAARHRLYRGETICPSRSPTA